MSLETCPMAPLVEAERDGRLGERERASLGRHLATCAICQAAAGRLERIAEHVRKPLGEPVSPLVHQRGRLALQRAFALGRPEAEPAAWYRRPSTWGFAGAAAMVALSVVVGARALSAGEPPRAATTLLPGASESKERTVTSVFASPGARFERTTIDGLDRVGLTEGTLLLRVKHLGAGERFLVATTDAEAEVRGTVFVVEAHEGKLARVEVREGKVEVRHHDRTTQLGAGAALTARESEPDPPRPVALEPREAPAPPPAKAARPLAPVASAWAFASASAAASARAPAAAHGDPAFAGALAKIEHGDDLGAASDLAALRARSPRDPRAEDAAFLEAIALQRAGKREAAAAAARKYLADYPKGSRRAAAQAIIDQP